jgi:hypothetical protein
MTTELLLHNKESIMTLTRFTLALSLLLASCGTAAANYEAQAPVYPPL